MRGRSKTIALFTILNGLAGCKVGDTSSNLAEDTFLRNMTASPTALEITVGSLSTITMTYKLGNGAQYTFKPTESVGVTSSNAQVADAYFSSVTDKNSILVTAVSPGTSTVHVFVEGTGLPQKPFVDIPVTVNSNAPIFTKLTPTEVVAGANVTITVDGSGFDKTSRIETNGQTITPTLVSSTQLTAALPASLTAAAGVVSLRVINPPPGGGQSVIRTLTVTAPPAPANPCDAKDFVSGQATNGELTNGSCDVGFLADFYKFNVTTASAFRIDLSATQFAPVGIITPAANRQDNLALFLGVNGATTINILAPVGNFNFGVTSFAGNNRGPYTFKVQPVTTDMTGCAKWEVMPAPNFSGTQTLGAGDCSRTRSLIPRFEDDVDVYLKQGTRLTVEMTAAGFRPMIFVSDFLGQQVGSAGTQNAGETATFTFTAAVTGAHTISLSSGGSATGSGPYSFTVRK